MGTCRSELSFGQSRHLGPAVQAILYKEKRMPFDLRTLVVSDRVQATRILRGPFRGAVIVMKSAPLTAEDIRLYEHELNPWLTEVLPRVTRVLDVGANDDISPSAVPRLFVG